MILKTNQMIALVSVLLVVCGLFLPWVTWEEYAEIPAGSTIGLKTVDGWILLVFALIAGYFSFEEPRGLNSLFTIIFGSFIFFGASLDIGAPQGFVPSNYMYVLIHVYPSVIHAAAGLYMEWLGGLLALLYGVFTIIRLPIPSSISKLAKKITRKVKSQIKELLEQIVDKREKQCLNRLRRENSPSNEMKEGCF
jgi:hypothetical protein